jgi:hypothetical protein
MPENLYGSLLRIVLNVNDHLGAGLESWFLYPVAGRPRTQPQGADANADAEDQPVVVCRGAGDVPAARFELDGQAFPRWRAGLVRLAQKQVWFVMADHSPCLWPLLSDPDPAKTKRVMEAMMKMKKIDIGGLQGDTRRRDGCAV